jgi:hypothetical protein
LSNINATGVGDELPNNGTPRGRVTGAQGFDLELFRPSVERWSCVHAARTELRVVGLARDRQLVERHDAHRLAVIGQVDVVAGSRSLSCGSPAPFGRSSSRPIDQEIDPRDQASHRRDLASEAHAMRKAEAGPRTALNLLRDSDETGRMPSGLPLEPDVREQHERAVDRLEELGEADVQDQKQSHDRITQEGERRCCDTEGGADKLIHPRTRLS